MKYTKGYALLIGLAIVASLEARVLTVGQGGTYAHIMDAIYHANPGDTVSVASGTVDSPAVYYEQIDFLGKDIIVAAREVGTNDWRAIDNPDPKATVINAYPGTYVVRFVRGESRKAVLRGFTLKGTLTPRDMPSDSSQGHGIYIVDASPTIEKNIIRGNQGLRGVGIRVKGSTSRPLIQNNIIRENSAIEFGVGGILVEDAAFPEIRQNLIYRNKGAGSWYYVISGGGIYVYQASAEIINNVIDSNEVEPNSGGIYRGAGVTFDEAILVTMHNNIITRNFTTNGLGVGVYDKNGSSSVLDLDYNDVWGNDIDYLNVQPGPNDLNVDPQFVDPSNYDFHLRPSSPLIDAGDNCVWQDWEKTDFEGNPRFIDGNGDVGSQYAITIDMGAFEYREGTALQCGDVNRDGVVDPNDPRYLYHFLIKDPGYEVCPIMVADVNEDGTVDMADYQYLDHYTQYGSPVPCQPADTSANGQALLATGDPQPSGNTISLPIQAYLTEVTSGYLLEFELPQGFQFISAELPSSLPSGLSLAYKTEGNLIRLIVTDTLPEDGTTQIPPGVFDVVNLELSYQGNPGSFTLTGTELQFVDSTSTRMISGFITGGPQTAVILEGLATQVVLPSGNILHDQLDVRLTAPYPLGNLRIQLVDITGRVVRTLYHGQVATNTLNFRVPVKKLGVSDGVYFLRVDSEKTHSVHRVILLRDQE